MVSGDAMQADVNASAANAFRAQPRSARATRAGALPESLVEVALAMLPLLVLDGARAVDSLVGVAVVPTAAAVLLVPVAAQGLLVALPPRLPPLIALPVAVQPAPGVDVLGRAVSVGCCANARPPAANTLAAIQGAKEMFILFIAGLLDVVGKRGR